MPSKICQRLRIARRLKSLAKRIRFTPPSPTIHLPFSVITFSFWSIGMSLQFTMEEMDDFPRDNALGSFEDLLQLLEDLEPDSPREPLGGMAFRVSPEEYLTLFEMEALSDQGPSDYSCGVVYYKNKTSHINRQLSDALTDWITGEIDQKWAKNKTLPPLLGSCYSGRAVVTDNQQSPTVDMAADVAISSRMFGRPGNRCPSLVVEIAYAHRFTRDKLEARYKEYFKEDRIQVVLCLDVLYARGPDCASKSASVLDCSAISMWIRNENGDIQTVMG
jgi:Uma2 family endonuclease